MCFIAVFLELTFESNWCANQMASLVLLRFASNAALFRLLK